jgi:hypothetical protein
MAFDPNTVQVDAAPKKAKFDPTSVKTDVPPPISSEPKEEKKSKTFREKAADIGIAGGVGTAVGAFAPELMTAAGMGAAVFPPTAPAAPFLLAGGQLLRGGRLASALSGGLSAAGGKAAGEFVPQPEKVVAEIPGVQLTRKDVAETAGEFLAPGSLKAAELAIRSAPVLGSVLRGLERFVGAGEQEFKKAAERELAGLRGKLPATFTEPYRKIFDALAGAEDKERRFGLQQATEAAKRAETIIAQYNIQANRAIKYNTAEAERLKKEGQKRAEDVIAQAAADIERRTGVLRKAQASGTAATERGQKAISSIGEQKTPTQIGTSIREAVEPIFAKLKSTRDENAKKYKGEAFEFALNKERAGQRVENTKAFKEAQEAIKSAITNPETKLKNVTINEVESQLQKVKRALDPREVVDNVVVGNPVSFEGLENLRRFLRDRSYGLPAEGFDAIGQQQAGKLADAVEKIQLEFTMAQPSLLEIARGTEASSLFKKFLEQYKADSEPLRIFKTKLGQSLVGKEEFDMTRFATDPAGLADNFFKSETGVKDLVTLLGGSVAQAEGVARSYLADRLRQGGAKDVEKVINDSRDWIGQFPALQQQLNAIARESGVAEKVAAKRGVLAKALRTDLAANPLQAATTTADKLREEAQKQSEQRVQKGLTQSEALRERGRKLAEVQEAPKVEGVLTGADPVAQIEGFITKGETQNLQKIAPAVRDNPELKKAFNQALDITLSRMAPERVIDDFERIIKPALTNTGLITPEKANQITQRLRVVQMTLEPSAAAQTARWIIRTTVSGELGMAVSPE